MVVLSITLIATIFICVGSVFYCKDALSKAEKLNIDYYDYLTLLSKRDKLRELVKIRGIKIKQLKTELCKQKPKKIKNDVAGVFINANNIANYKFENSLCNIEVIDIDGKYCAKLSNCVNK